MAVQRHPNRLQDISATRSEAVHLNFSDYLSDPLMANTSEILTAPNTLKNDERGILLLADVCFEMFPIKELRQPRLIINELRAEFPQFEDPEILRAISMALSWRRLLRAAGRPLH